MSQCQRCGGTSDGSTIVCQYCGNVLVALATVEDELRALHELGQAAAALAISIGSNQGGILAIYTSAGDRIVRQQKLAEFWKNAFLPTHALSQVRAMEQCVHQVSPQGGELDDFMIHRASMLLESLKGRADADPATAHELPRLTALVEAARKRKGSLIRRTLYITGGVFGGCIGMLSLIVWMVGGTAEAPRPPMTLAGTYTHDGHTLRVEPGWLVLDDKRLPLGEADVKGSASATFTDAVLTKGIIVDDKCSGSLSRTERTIVVTIENGSAADCHVFAGEWSDVAAVAPASTEKAGAPQSR